MNERDEDVDVVELSDEQLGEIFGGYEAEVPVCRRADSTNTR